MYILYMTKTSASVAEVRGQLARILRLVEGGQEVTVTRHGRGVAKIVPVRDAMERLAAVGVRPAERRDRLPKVRPSMQEVRRPLTRAVLEGRA